MAASNSIYDIGYLRSINYQELRIIAKGLGIKGRLVKADKLIDAILEKKGMNVELDATYTEDTDKKLRRRTYSLSPPKAKDENSKPSTSGIAKTDQKPPRIQTNKRTNIPKLSKQPQRVQPIRKVAASPAPDFKKLHQKEFERMKSLDEYVADRNKRMKMMQTPAKLCRSIPKKASEESSVFKPQVLSTRKMNLNFNDMPTSKTTAAPGPPKAKSDLKLNMVKRTKYVPYKGKLKDFSNASQSPVPKYLRDLQREERRTVIRGVRTNKRFDLLLQMRGVKH